MIASLIDTLCHVNVSTPFWADYPSIIIYGAGNVGKDVFNALSQRGVPISCFLDRKAQANTYWNGVPIFQPDSDVISFDQRKRACVIIAIHNRDVDIPPILEKLRALGYGHIVNLIELWDQVGKDLGDRYWLTERAYYKSLEPFITAGLDLWNDETSRSLYAATVRFRLTGDYSVLPLPDSVHQYFPTDLPAWKMPLRFVDCGAFNGDTIQNAMAMDIPIEAVAAFEPDQNNFRNLASFVDANRIALPTVALWPCGVSSSTRQLRFISGEGESSRLSSSGDLAIQCVSLDEAIPHFAPTLIKMDIEGGEYDALLGARKTIVRYKPGLAISLYHRPEHLWQIPLLLKHMVLWGGVQSVSTCGHMPSLDSNWLCMQFSTESYRFFLRSHGFNSFDLVLYAIPG